MQKLGKSEILYNVKSQSEDIKFESVLKVCVSRTVSKSSGSEFHAAGPAKKNACTLNLVCSIGVMQLVVSEREHRSQRTALIVVGCSARFQSDNVETFPFGRCASGCRVILNQQSVQLNEAWHHTFVSSKAKNRPCSCVLDTLKWFDCQLWQKCQN